MKSLLNGSKYIGYNEFNEICEENRINKDEKLLNENNKKYLNRKLIEYKEYFDHIFTDVGENINLDEEQRRIVLRDDDYCLINAGAGSGKSTTMAAKVKYLVDKLHIRPEEIIMLTFTKKSSEDLDEKVNELLDLGIPVSTFHSLGMQFIKRFYPFPIKVVGEEEKKKIIENYIKDNFENKQKMKELIDTFRICDRKTYIAKGFVENYNKFKTFDQYFEDYKKRKYKSENNKKGGIHSYIEYRLGLQNSLYTIRGERVKSAGELKIANFLYINGIDYTYEKIYEEKVNEDRTYQPDFTIEVQGKKVYIEYFGLSNCYNENNELIKKEVDKYNRTRRIKEIFQKNSKEDFINLDYKNRDGSIIESLKNALKLRKIELDKKSEHEIFYKIIDNNLSSEFFKFSGLIIKFIEILKDMLVDDVDYLFNKRINQIKEEKFQYFYYSTDIIEERQKRIRTLEFLREIYKYYQNYLIKNQMIDYNDMINLSYKHIIKEVKNKYQDLNYKYIVVDEYQDITFQRFLFVKRLTEYFDAKLIAVGDDWQSIYAFTGSRLELFNEFSKLFIESKNDMILSTTYRYGQELVDITSKFILENEEQSYKQIKSIKSLENPIEICECREYETFEKINKIVHKIYNENPDDKILILARTNEKLRQLNSSIFFSKGIGDILICNDIPNAKIEAITMHRSKGLTADQVIVFGLKEGVFPSIGKNYHWIFDYFKLDRVNEQNEMEKFYELYGLNSLREAIPFAEERRLFYVALTRTRNKVFLVTPDSRKSKSCFVNEIEEMIKKV